jgi:hypothetical protein
MGFFGRLFAKKKGGTRVGNFFRRWLWRQSYGLLGTEDGTPAREQNM